MQRLPAEEGIFFQNRASPIDEWYIEKASRNNLKAFSWMNNINLSCKHRGKKESAFETEKV